MQKRHSSISGYSEIDAMNVRDIDEEIENQIQEQLEEQIGQEVVRDHKYSRVSLELNDVDVIYPINQHS